MHCAFRFSCDSFENLSHMEYTIAPETNGTAAAKAVNDPKASKTSLATLMLMKKRTSDWREKQKESAPVSQEFIYCCLDFLPK